MVASMVVKGSRRGFNSLVVLIAWLLWWERNDRVFNGVHKLAHQLATFTISLPPLNEKRAQQPRSLKTLFAGWE
jgi:hypothetical protein